LGKKNPRQRLKLITGGKSAQKRNDLRELKRGQGKVQVALVGYQQKDSNLSRAKWMGELKTLGGGAEPNHGL